MNKSELVEIEKGFTLSVNAQRKPRADESGKLTVQLVLAEQFAFASLTGHLERELRSRYGNCTAWDVRGVGEPHVHYVVEVPFNKDVLVEADALELLAAQARVFKLALLEARRARSAASRPGQ